MKRKLALGFVLPLVAVAMVAISWLLLLRNQEREFREEMTLARQEYAAGRVESARKRLSSLAGSRADDGEVPYLIGLCEQAKGQAKAALTFWKDVPPGSRFATKAAVRRARLLVNIGRLAEAEAILESTPPGIGEDASLLRQSLELVNRIEGRSTEARGLIMESWSGADDPGRVLWGLYMVDHATFPSELVKQIIAKGDPKDDRIPLVKANLAIISGQYDEARQLIESCLAREPDDPVVWR